MVRRCTGRLTQDVGEDFFPMSHRSKPSRICATNSGNLGHFRSVLRRASMAFGSGHKSCVLRSEEGSSRRYCYCPCIDQYFYGLRVVSLSCVVQWCVDVVSERFFVRPHAARAQSLLSRHDNGTPLRTTCLSWSLYCWPLVPPATTLQVRVPPLMITACKGHSTIVETLLVAGAGLNIHRTGTGSTR